MVERTLMSEQAAIRGVALDYIEGWYEASAARMDKALYERLAKRRIVSSDEVWEVSRDWMVEATAEGRGRLDHPGQGRRDVVILDETPTMASVKVIAERFTDYLHLAKIEGTWKIVNVLWDLHPDAE